jgi:site-specific DNA-methyltransferase (adenine-specific)
MKNRTLTDGTLPVNRLIVGDNLEIMKRLEEESVDLIYLDTPFFSNRKYEIICGDAGEIRSFEDRWAGGIDHYVMWLKERVMLMHRLLKKTGSIFLHCDWHADAYIRVDILDKIFGMKNFRNAIDWCYNVGGKSKNQFARKKDTIFWYSKTRKWTFNGNCVGIKRDTGTKSMGGKIGVDENGRPYQDKIVRLSGKIYRYYLDEDKIPEDWWIDINSIQSGSNERIGYPTQKPEALLERIIKCASNEGDLILDPFMGGGTTAAVADRLNRKWIGIDQSAVAIRVTELRLDKQQGLFSPPFSVEMHRYDYDTLRYSDAFEFESWIVRQFGGTPNLRQRGDFGLDGILEDGTPLQVKRSDGIGRNVIDNFKSAAERVDKKVFAQNKKEKKPIGYIIAFSFSKGAIEEVARLKLKDGIVIELVTVDSIVALATKPTITIKMQEISREAKSGTEIEFSAKATGESEISFYTWDFCYDEEKGFMPHTIIDKTGMATHVFSAGTHTIAVKVVDNEGLESIETVKLKVNGGVKKV